MEFVNGIPYLPGAAACLEQLDRTILLILRDGRHLIGLMNKCQFVDQITDMSYVYRYFKKF